MDLKPYMTAAAFGDLIGRDQRTIAKWCSLGYLPHYRQGREYQIATFQSLYILADLSDRGADIKEAVKIQKPNILPGSQKAKDLISKLFGKGGLL